MISHVELRVSCGVMCFSTLWSYVFFNVVKFMSFLCFRPFNVIVLLISFCVNVFELGVVDLNNYFLIEIIYLVVNDSQLLEIVSKCVRNAWIASSLGINRETITFKWPDLILPVTKVISSISKWMNWNLFSLDVLTIFPLIGSQIYILFNRCDCRLNYFRRLFSYLRIYTRCGGGRWRFVWGRIDMCVYLCVYV